MGMRNWQLARVRLVGTFSDFVRTFSENFRTFLGHAQNVSGTILGPISDQQKSGFVTGFLTNLPMDGYTWLVGSDV